ncbi:MAG: LutC/YkgG family protein [Alphaproteobacteria bacterium]
MTSDRADILARVRGAIGRTENSGPPAAPEYANARLIPERAQGTPADLVVRFVDMATEAGVTVNRIRSTADIGASVAGWLRDNGLPTDIVVAPDPALDAAGWGAATALSVRRGAATGDDKVTVNSSVAGIAETGTVMVAATPQTPYTLNFLPDTHIVVVRAEDIVGSYEDAWAKLRPGNEAGGALPRTVTLITGPSRSSDIERIVTVGVHGPLRLHILLVGQADGEEKI